MSSAGLSRRRVPGPASADDDRPSSGHSDAAAPHPTAPQAHAGSAFAGGARVAYDPRDIDQDASEEARIGGKMPRLTIMEEVLLLGIKDKQVCRYVVD